MPKTLHPPHRQSRTMSMGNADKTLKMKGSYRTLIVMIFYLTALWLPYSSFDPFQLHDALSDRSLQPRLAISQHAENHTTIPHRLLFTYKHNLLQEEEPENLYLNVMNIIQMYAELWNVSTEDVDVMFLDDTQCLDLIRQTEPRLIKPFETEERGAYKADICRVAALYLYGGYYFDVDIQPIIPLNPDPQVDFISASNKNRQFFQAVLAVAPSHPTMKANLQSMLDEWYMLKTSSLTPNEFNVTIFRSADYQKDLRKYVRKSYNIKKYPMVGTATLWMAYEKVKDQINPWILHEIWATEMMHPEFRRQEKGWGCNYVVVGRTANTDRSQRLNFHINWPSWNEDKHWKAYFYSRARGTGGCPYVPSEATN